MSRSTYAGLFAVLGTAHGDGDGTTTFNLPDYRGRFLRGVDGNAGRDPDAAARLAAGRGGNSGNSVGSVQDGQVGAHTHGIGFGLYEGGAGSGPLPQVNPTTTPGNVTHSTTAVNSGSETRPTNAYVNWIIKY